MKRVASALAIAAAAAFAATHLRVASDLDYFLPDGNGPAKFGSDVIRALTASPLARRIVLSVQGRTHEQAVEGAQRLLPLLAPLPLEPLSAGNFEAVGRLLFEHRWQLASARPAAELPALLSRPGLDAAAARLEAALASPAGSLVRAVAAQDPLLLSRAQLERVAALDQRGLKSEGGVLTAGDRAFIFATSTAPAFDAPAQRALWSGIDAAFARVDAALGGGLRLEHAGLGRFTVAAERSIRTDTTRISVVSTLAILLIIWVVFGRLGVLPGIVWPLAAGFVAGTAGCLLVFGRVHGMTFAFGSSLMGVCIDYPLPLTNHRCLGRPDDPVKNRALLRALFLGCLTTIVGIAAMAGTSIPGLREIAVFGCCGIAVAFLIAVIWLPPVPARRPPARIDVALATTLTRVVALWRQGRWVGALPLVLGVLIAAGGLSRVRWQDDPRSLTSADPAIEREDQRVRDAAFGPEETRFVVASATVAGEAGVDEALARNDDLYAALEEARAAGEVSGFASLHALLPSRRLQEENAAWIAAHFREQDLRAALAARGFVASAFAPFGPGGVASLRSLAPLTAADYPAPVRQALIDPWFIVMGGKPAVLTRLSGVRDPRRLAARLTALPHVRQVDVEAFRIEAYARFRQRLLQLLGVGLIIVILVLLVRYREPRRALAALTPAVLAAVATVAIFALLRLPLNLMHVMGLLLVLSMGADYGIFLVESEADDSPAAPAALSVAMSCLATVLSFGLLGASRVPALAAVGQTIGVGILLALVLSPSALILVAPRAAGGPR